MSTPKFEVVRLQPVQNAGNLRAFASVKVGGRMVIHDCRLVQQPNQQPFASPPQKTYEAPDGGKRYSTLIEFTDPAWKDALTAAIVEAWEQFPEGIKPVPEPGRSEQPSAFRQEVRQKAGIGGGR